MENVEFDERKKMFSMMMSFFQKIPSMLLLLDFEGKVCAVSDNFLEIFLYKNENIENKMLPISHLNNEQYNVIVSEWSALSEQDSWTNEMPVIDSSGSIHQVEIKISKYEYPLDKNIKYIAVCNHLKAQENEIKEIHQDSIRIQAILDNAVNAILVIDEIGCVESFNKGAEKLFNYAAQEVINNNVTMLMPEPYKRNHPTYLSRYADTGEKKIIGIGREVKAQRKDGSIFPIQLAVGEMVLGNQKKYLGIITDISDLKKTQEELLKERDKAQMYLDVAGAIIIILDMDFNVKLINKKGCLLLGADRKDVIGFNWFDKYVPEEERSLSRQYYQNIISEDKETAITYIGDIVNNDQTVKRNILWNNTVLKDEFGQVIGCLASGEDITERKEMDNMKTELINTVSHEIRTPLASIRGFIELLLNRELSAEKTKAYLKTVNRETERLNALVDDFLDIQRIENHQQTMKKIIFDMGEVIHEVVDVFSANEEHDIKAAKIAPNAYVFADFDKIKRVIINLVSNACKYSNKGEPVYIECNINDNRVLVSVIDKGIGIPRDALDKLFNKFYRVETKAHQKVGGTGLGLSICKGIIETHEGKIWADSICGLGSQFYFELPLASLNIEEVPKT